MNKFDLGEPVQWQYELGGEIHRGVIMSCRANSDGEWFVWETQKPFPAYMAGEDLMPG